MASVQAGRRTNRRDVSSSRSLRQLSNVLDLMSYCIPSTPSSSRFDRFRRRRLLLPKTTCRRSVVLSVTSRCAMGRPDSTEILRGIRVTHVDNFRRPSVPNPAKFTHKWWKFDSKLCKNRHIRGACSFILCLPHSWQNAKKINHQSFTKRKTPSTLDAFGARQRSCKAFDPSAAATRSATRRLFNSKKRFRDTSCEHIQSAGHRRNASDSHVPSTGV